jgi:type I restriction enzyme S subunit
MSSATTHIENVKELVPVLRFKEFDGEWENNRLHDLTNLITKGTTPKTFTSSGVNYVKIEGLVGININKDKCVHIDEEVHLKELKRSILQENDLLFAIAGATVGKVGIVTSDILPANTNQALAIIRLKNKDYLNYILQILQSRVMKKYIYQSVSVGAQPNLNLEQIGDFRFNLPSLPEQQKIASFLSAVDEKIQQLTKKKALLEQYKKGVMQQLFPSSGSGQRSGQLRFKDANGKAYPDWEDTLLGDCLKYVQPTKYLVSSTEYDNSFETPVLTAGKTFVLGYTNEKENICNDIPLIIFDDFTTASKYVDFPFKAKSSAMKLLLAKEGVDVKFMFEAMQNIKFEVGGHGRHWISIFSQLVVSVPSINEQQKIATYLSGIDTKIGALNNQITQTQTFKKGLLQQMFV